MRNKGTSEKRGISLIVLVITIIVIIILAVAVILSIANNNPIENANKAKFQSDLRTIQEELNLYNSSAYAKSQIEKTEYISAQLSDLNSANKYTNKLKIKDGTLYIDANNLSQKEVEWANEIGIMEIEEDKWGNIKLTGFPRLETVVEDENTILSFMRTDKIYEKNRELVINLIITAEEGIKWNFHLYSSWVQLDTEDCSGKTLEIPLILGEGKDNYRDKIYEFSYTIEATGKTFTKRFSLYDLYGRGEANLSSEIEAIYKEGETVGNFPPNSEMQSNIKVNYNLINKEYDVSKYELYFITILKGTKVGSSEVEELKVQKEYVDNFNGNINISYEGTICSWMNVDTVAVICEKENHVMKQVVGELKIDIGIEAEKPYSSGQSMDILHKDDTLN